jgi:hypothetical protein
VVGGKYSLRHAYASGFQSEKIYYSLRSKCACVFNQAIHDSYHANCEQSDHAPYV